MTTSEKKSHKAKLRWAISRFEKNKATESDLDLIKEMKPEYDLSKEVERQTEIVTPKDKGVQNSKDYFSGDVDSFISDANDTFKNDQNNDQVFEPLETDEPETEPKAETQKDPEGLAIDGALLLFMIDLIAPQLFAWAGKKFLKKNIQPSDLKSYEDLSPLQKAADLVSQKIAVNDMPPEQILIIGIFFIYGTKLLTFQNIEE